MISEKNKEATLLIDGHVHIYPQYNLKQAIQIGINNLRFAAKKSSSLHYLRKKKVGGYVYSIWLLTERSDCNFFEDAIKSIGEFENNGFRLLPSDERETLIVEKARKPILYILAGRQIITKEGLEILSLTSKLFLKDREKSTDDVIDKIVYSNGIAVLNWAPGKWFFNRGKVVKRLLKEQSPKNLLICDTSLRATIWPKPKKMTIAQQQGFKVIAGSDPLPFYGEEKFVGSYGFCLKGEFDPQRPADSIRAHLRQPSNKISLIGKRNDIVTFCQRIYKILTEHSS